MALSGLAKLARECQSALNSCLSAENSLLDERAKDALEEQRGLFNTWAANCNIFARSRASLEYRLREAPYVESLAREALTDIYETIKTGC